MNRKLRSPRGSSAVEALVAVTVLTLACLLVYQAAHLSAASTTYDASRRQVQDLLEAKCESWRRGSPLVVEEGVLQSGALFRFTPEVVSTNGVEQLRVEVIWAGDSDLPTTSAGWPLRVTAVAMRLP